MMDGFAVDLPKPFVFALAPMQSHSRYDTGRKELERNVILYDNADYTPDFVSDIYRNCLFWVSLISSRYAIFE